MLPHAEVYITDWVDARMVPLGHESFTFKGNVN